MKKEVIHQLHKNFEDCARQNDGVEYGLARGLQTLLGYKAWRNFDLVIDKAKVACEKAGQAVVELGSQSQREVEDIALTRYACYLIAQNGDPRKDAVAFAMTYFAVQTRKQELIETRMAEWERLRAREKLTLSQKELSGVLFERGIDSPGFSPPPAAGNPRRFRSAGGAVGPVAHVDAQVVALLGVGGTPHLAQQLPVGQHPTRVGDQH
jgi:DNA-damage-inducible protein D